MLQLLIKAWAEVSVDGTRAGTTPMRPISLPAGTHVVPMTHPDYKPLQRKVTLRARARRRSSSWTCPGRRFPRI